MVDTKVPCTSKMKVDTHKSVGVYFLWYKMLCFQGLYSFYRKHPISLNFLKTIENTG